MKAHRETLEGQKADYEEKLRGLKAYASELKAMADKHGTDSSVYEHGLTKAAHDAEFYEAELQRLGGELSDSYDTLSFRVFEDGAGEWRWHLRSANGRVVADSGEGYATKRGVRRAIDRLTQAMIRTQHRLPVREVES